MPKRKRTDNVISNRPLKRRRIIVNRDALAPLDDVLMQGRDHAADSVSSDVAQFVNSLSRKQLQFRHSTIEELRNGNFKQGKNPISGRLEPYYQCQRCEEWFQYEASDIGHRTDWKTYLMEQGVKNLQEAREAYNDIDNLWLECSACNRSHAFEELLPENEDYDYSDGFVVPDNDGDRRELEEARKFIKWLYQRE